MKIKKIYDTAIRIINKNIVDIYYEGYMDRTPYIIATFCCANAAVDRDFRESHGLPPQQHFNEVELNLEDDFPFDSRFAAPTAYYLAAMLLIDEDNSISEDLFNIYSEYMTKVQCDIPMKKGKILNVYP